MAGQDIDRILDRLKKLQQDSTYEVITGDDLRLKGIDIHQHWQLLRQLHNEGRLILKIDDLRPWRILVTTK